MIICLITRNIDKIEAQAQQQIQSRALGIRTEDDINKPMKVPG